MQRRDQVGTQQGLMSDANVLIDYQQSAPGILQLVRDAETGKYFSISSPIFEARTGLVEIFSENHHFSL